MHASLTLEAQGIDVAFPPELRAAHHAYQWLLSDTVGFRVRVGTLDAHRALRLGTLAPDIEAIEVEIAAIVAARQAEAEAGESEESDEDAEEPDEDAEESDERKRSRPTPTSGSFATPRAGNWMSIRPTAATCRSSR